MSNDRLGSDFYMWIISRRVDLNEGFKGSRGQGFERNAESKASPLENKHLIPGPLGPFLPTDWEKNHKY